jgi:lysophospholipase L1-like esterase
MRPANLVTGCVATVAMLVVGAMALKNKRDLREIAAYRAIELAADTAQRSIKSHGDGSIVVLGDSVTSNARLPSSVCGIKLVNAAFGGARASMLIPLLEAITASHVRPKQIVVSVGVNNANVDYWNEDTFAATYEALLRVASAVAPTIVATVAPVEYSLPVGKTINKDARERINEMIVSIAEAKGIDAIPLGDIAAADTLDGVHLGPDGYRKWIPRILNRLSVRLGCVQSSGY